MDLPIVRKVRHLFCLIAVLDETARVCVAVDAVPLNEPDARPIRLAEPVAVVAIDRDDPHTE